MSLGGYYSAPAHGGGRMIRGIKLVSVPVTDQDRSLQFFTEKLGFKVMFVHLKSYPEFALPVHRRVPNSEKYQSLSSSFLKTVTTVVTEINK